VSGSDGRRRTVRDERRRRLGQNFLLPDVAESFVAQGSFAPGELVIEIGAGRGACTQALARLGVDVVAIERDPQWAAALRRDMRRAGFPGVQVVEGNALALPLDRLTDGRPYRVVGSLPFGVTTALLRHLFDDVGHAPWRADLIVQWEVARKRAAVPPTTMVSTTWAPWWTFELVRRIPARSFRPVPAVDAGVLRVTRRTPALLPERLAGGFAEFVRREWG
jgi:23S rRNA (adenine-N6)-dimethyltransferase